LAGAAGVLVAAERNGWLHGTRTVLVRAPIVRDVSPTTVVVSKPVLARGFAPERIFAERSSGVVTVFAYYAATAAGPVIEQGSGFVVSRRGLVLTAAHVIASTSAEATASVARTVYVQFADGDRIPATIVGWDPYDDVGLLHVNPGLHALDPLPLGSSADLRVGQPVAAIGSPFGNDTSLSVGVVSGTNRTIPSLASGFNLFGAIQTDAPINEGSSGGPLLDAHGRVIGINAQIRSGLDSAFAGVGFAVPVDSVRRSLAQLLSLGRVPYAYLGLTSESLTPAIAARFGYPSTYGAIVVSVAPGGPAARAGLAAGAERVVFEGQPMTVGGDVILAIDGTRVQNSDELAGLVAQRMAPGQSAWLTVVHDGHVRRVRVVLGARPN
jgi:S1-C subfamily serine protease